jgi:hypothetical protein
MLAIEASQFDGMKSPNEQIVDAECHQDAQWHNVKLAPDLLQIRNPENYQKLSNRETTKYNSLVATVLKNKRKHNLLFEERHHLSKKFKYAAFKDDFDQ